MNTIENNENELELILQIEYEYEKNKKIFNRKYIKCTKEEIIKLLIETGKNEKNFTVEFKEIPLKAKLQLNTIKSNKPTKFIEMINKKILDEQNEFKKQNYHKVITKIDKTLKYLYDYDKQNKLNQIKLQQKQFDLYQYDLKLQIMKYQNKIKNLLPNKLEITENKRIMENLKNEIINLEQQKEMCIVNDNNKTFDKLIVNKLNNIINEINYYLEKYNINDVKYSVSHSIFNKYVFDKNLQKQIDQYEDKKYYYKFELNKDANVNYFQDYVACKTDGIYSTHN